MNLKSLGYRTDLIFFHFDGKVIDCGGYIHVETPSNPHFFWGNLLIFSCPPENGDLPKWKRIFETKFQHNPLIRHITLAWDGIDGEVGVVQPFLDDGFKLEESIVLATSKVTKPRKYANELQVRPIKEDWEWEAVTENQIVGMIQGYNRTDFPKFKRTQMARYRNMVKAGRGEWFGGFLGKQVVADLGIFTEGGLGRFQSVVTHPDHRRQGYCGTLVYQSSLHALEKMGVTNLVIVSDETYYATQAYQSVGFKASEKQRGLCWWPNRLE